MWRVFDPWRRHLRRHRRRVSVAAGVSLIVGVVMAAFAVSVRAISADPRADRRDRHLPNHPLLADESHLVGL